MNQTHEYLVLLCEGLRGRKRDQDTGLSHGRHDCRQLYKLLDQVMNVDPSSKYHSDHPSVLSNDDGNGNDFNKTQSGN